MISLKLVNVGFSSSATKSFRTEERGVARYMTVRHPTVLSVAPSDFLNENQNYMILTTDIRKAQRKVFAYRTKD